MVRHSAPDPLSAVYVVRAPAGGGRKHARCRLDVSVGQPYHEGEKLKATVDWVNRYAGDPFDWCDIVVVDSLQRHTMAARDGTDPATALQKATEQGDEWIARNQSVIDALRVPVSLLRWQMLIEDPQFRAMRARLDALVAAEPLFADAIERGAELFVSRARKHGAVIRDEPLWLRCSRDYLIEEMAVIAILQEVRPAIDCYPGSWLPFEAIKTGVPGVPDTLRDLEWAQLRFKRRPGATVRPEAAGAGPHSVAA
jgi:tRNA-dependent cyclodipeptide synthase